MSIDVRKKLDREIATFASRSMPQHAKQTQKVTYSQFLGDRMLIISGIRNGIPYSLFSLIKDVTPFTENDWAELLSLSAKSLHRYKQTSQRFKPLQSEKIVEMAEVAEAGREVFGDMDKFRLWLDTPNFALGGQKPFDLLKDSYGKELVLGELVRIEHGILS